MPVTIDDVARDLGLSASTVSKALNDYREISAETKARVVATAQKLGYHPSAAARSLRRRVTERIGIVNTSTSYNFDYFPELLRGVTAASEQVDYNLVLYTNIHHQPQRLQRICRGREVDGVLLITADDVNEAVDAFIAEELPVVIVGRRVARPDVSFIAPDAVQSAFIAVRHLIELGHRRIGLLNSLLDLQAGVDRLAGYRQALGEAGIEFDPGLVVDAPFRPGGGCVPTDQLLAQDPRPTAIFAISNSLAVEALQSIAAHDLRVPQDIAIAAVEDTRLSLMTTPPLTSVRQPLFEMGSTSVEILARTIEAPHRAPEQIIRPVSLVVRGSSVEA